jgi:hypothetical protein
MLGSESGFHIPIGAGSLRVAHPCIGERLRRVGAEEMNWAYSISGLIALALLVYLIAAHSG